jgi:hypothetical protein
MNLTAPTQFVFVVSLFIAILAMVGHFAFLPVVSEYKFWFAIVSYAVLATACLMKDI